MQNHSFIVESGTPLPYGATCLAEGVNFAFHAESQKASLCLFCSQTHQLLHEIPLNPSRHRTGLTWHLTIKDLSMHFLYAFRLDDQQQLVLDPYAKEIATTQQWGHHTQEKPYSPLGCIHTCSENIHHGSEKPNHQIHDLIIYEMHVRGFTRHASSQTQDPGTFLGVIEKIPHLLELGVNAVELLPIFEFDECETMRVPYMKGLTNYWGYSTVNFFSPMQRYATSSIQGKAVQEFKRMVTALHQHGIEVILDVVYNHTSEGNERGPSYCFKSLDNVAYYLLDKEDHYLNFSGCGNTFNCNHPLTLKLIIDTLRYWVTEMGVDGFRFDLASIFFRGKDGKVLNPSAILEAITYDSILSKTKLIAEPWDAAGLYQVGSFTHQLEGKWSEWNGRYRDVIRQFIKGTGNKSEFATCLCGSQNLYWSYTPACSVNFIASHDGFTLHDLVSYNDKHNQSNRENNRDGISCNDSWNCGVEGPTDDKTILALRLRQMKNFHLALMISRGIPMLHMGDEYGHTKKGNNNTWCQDNELNWFLWERLKENDDFFEFYKHLIVFRKEHAFLRSNRFLSAQEIVWHGRQPHQPDWNSEDQFLAFVLHDLENKTQFFVAFNASPKETEVRLPELSSQQFWKMIVNTSEKTGQDFSKANESPCIQESMMKMKSYSSLLASCCLASSSKSS